MSRVDKKPTYEGASKVTLACWARADRRPDLMDALFGDAGGQIMSSIATARGIALELVDTEDIRPGLDKTVIFATTKVALRAPNIRQPLAQEWLLALLKDSKNTYWGSDAAFILAAKYRKPARLPLDYAPVKKAMKVATEVSCLVAEDAFTVPDYHKMQGDIIANSSTLLALFSGILAIRKTMTKSLGDDVYKAWACVADGRKYDATAAVLRATAPLDRFRVHDHPLLVNFDRMYSVVGIWVLVQGEDLLFVDKEARNKVRQMVNSTYQAKAYLEVMNLSGFQALDPLAGRRQLDALWTEVELRAKGGRSVGDVVAALGKLHMSAFQSLPEARDPENLLGRKYGQELKDAAVTLWGGVNDWADGWGDLESYELMEATKLGSIFCAEDAKPDKCVERLEAAQEFPRSYNQATWTEFMAFVKTYDVCMELVHNGAFPALSGVEPSGEWVDKCKNGKFTMPPREDWGTVWIQGAYDDADTCPYEWLDAQDVTWVAPYADHILDVSNELVEAWEYGPLIDRKREGAEAANHSLLHGILLYWATKAEGKKRAGKMRMTASADAGSRALFSSFEDAERRHTSVTPGFGQNLSAFQLADKMEAIAERCDRNVMSATSSHDVEGWSEFENRACKDEYLAYEAQKFKDPQIAKSNHLWDKVHSVFKRLGHEYDGMFEQGGVQGLNGAADTLFHAKIVAYVHQKGLEKGIIDGGANVITCIDDVCYNPNTRIPSITKRSQVIRDHIADIYRKLAYPLDPMKSLMGIMKYVFLNDAYSDKAMVASPLRIAHKMDADETNLIRDIHTDVSSFMSTASAMAVAQCNTVVSYYFGVLNACVYLYGHYDQYVPYHKEHAAVWLLAPPGEGGMGIPTYREFMAGADPDRSFTWRDAVSRSGHAGPAHASALAAMSGYNIMSVSASATFRDPFAIVHDYPLCGAELKKKLVEKEMNKHKHAKEWDWMRESGETHVEQYADALVEDGGVIDAVISADMANCYPDTIHSGLVTRFASGSAILHLAPARVVFSIARAVARADRKWMEKGSHVVRQAGYASITDPHDTCKELRGIVHSSLICVNNVIPSPRAYVAYHGMLNASHAHRCDFVHFNAKTVKAPGRRFRIDQKASAEGRRVGTRSTRVTMSDISRTLKKSVVGCKLVKAALIVQILKSMGQSTDTFANSVEAAWDLDYSIDAIQVAEGPMSLKRASSVTSRQDCLALGARNVYGSAVTRLDIYMNYCSTQYDHTLVNPMLIAHTLKMCAISASVLVGLEGYTYESIMWSVAPAADVPYHYNVHPSAFVCDTDREFAPTPRNKDVFHVPTLGDLERDTVAAGLGWGVTTGGISNPPEVKPVAVYKVRVEKPDVGTCRPTRALVPVRRAAPTTSHGKNLVMSSIVRTRMAELLQGSRVDVERCIWGDTPANIPCPPSFIDKIVSDANVVLGVAIPHLNTVLNHYTRSNKYTDKNPAEIHQALCTCDGDKKAIVKAAYDGIVGKSDDAYASSQRGLVVVKNPAAYNEKERVRVLNLRNGTLVKRYRKLLSESRHAREASYYQGRLVARVVFSYTREGLSLPNGARIREHYAVTSGLSPEVVSGLIPEHVSRNTPVSVNARIARTETGLGWVHDRFAEGYYKEVGYMDGDWTEMQDRVFAIGANEMDNTEGTKVWKWHLSNPKVKVVEEVQAGAAAALLATVGNLFDSDSDDMGFLDGAYNSSSDEDSVGLS